MKRYLLIAIFCVQVFYRVSARLNWEIFRSIGNPDSQALLRRIAAETEVDWHEACDGYIISGTFEQLQNANRELNKYVVSTLSNHISHLRHTYLYSVASLSAV